MEFARILGVAEWVLELLTVVFCHLQDQDAIAKVAKVVPLAQEVMNRSFPWESDLGDHQNMKVLEVLEGLQCEWVVAALLEGKFLVDVPKIWRVQLNLRLRLVLHRGTLAEKAYPMVLIWTDAVGGHCRVRSPEACYWMQLELLFLAKSYGWQALARWRSMSSPDRCHLVGHHRYPMAPNHRIHRS